MFNKQIMVLFLAMSLTLFACDDDKKLSTETDLDPVAGVEISDLGVSGTEPVEESEAGTEPVEAGTEPVEEPEAGVEIVPEAGAEAQPEEPVAGEEEDQSLPG